MATNPLAIRVEQRLPHTVVALAGTLTVPTVASLRRTLLDCLADCPDAIVIDLSALTVETDLPLAVFRSVHRYAATWPIIPVLLCAPPPALSDRLAYLGIDRAQPVLDGRPQALTAAAGTRAAARTDRQLRSSVNAPAQARDLMAQLCRAWDQPELVDPARLIASELVTNAVLHARAAPYLTAVLRHPYLHVVVRDDSPDPPVRRAPPPVPDLTTALSGWGLQLLDLTAHSWGHVTNDGGKAVWAMLRCRRPASGVLDRRHPPLMRPYSTPQHHRSTRA